jgi:hypothetical protein
MPINPNQTTGLTDQYQMDDSNIVPKYRSTIAGLQKLPVNAPAATFSALDGPDTTTSGPVDQPEPGNTGPGFFRQWDSPNIPRGNNVPVPNELNKNYKKPQTKSGKMSHPVPTPMGWPTEYD